MWGQKGWEQDGHFTGLIPIFHSATRQSEKDRQIEEDGENTDRDIHADRSTER